MAGKREPVTEARLEAALLMRAGAHVSVQPRTERQAGRDVVRACGVLRTEKGLFS